jgi:hypothetical protein
MVPKIYNDNNAADGEEVVNASSSRGSTDPALLTDTRGKPRHARGIRLSVVFSFFFLTLENTHLSMSYRPLLDFFF